MAGIGGTVPPEPEVQHTYAPLPPAAEGSADWKPPKLPWWRRALAAVSGAVALVILWMATRKTDLTALVGGGKVSAAGWQTLATYGIFLAAMFVLVASIGRRGTAAGAGTDSGGEAEAFPPNGGGLRADPADDPRDVGGVRGPLWPHPLLYHRPAGDAGVYAAVFMVFEGRRPQARELTVIAVLCALGVAGRAAFFMLPQFKPGHGPDHHRRSGLRRRDGLSGGGHDHAGQ